MNFHSECSYHRWCEENGQPILVVPQGILRIGSNTYAEDGFLYTKGRKIDRYMVIERYGGNNVLVRSEEKNNIHRFEALRWKLLQRVKLINERCLGTLQDLKNLLGDPAQTGNTIRAVGDVNGVWRYIDMHGDDATISTGTICADKLEVLDRIVTLVRSDEEHALVRQYFRTKALLVKYWSKVRRFETCLSSLLTEIHPERRRPWGRPMIEVIINGRNYIVNSVSTEIHKSSEHWPSPLHRRFVLDRARLVEIK